MNEMLINIISVLVTAVVIPVISLLGAKLVSWLSTKIKNEKANKMIKTATEIVVSAVKTVFQTYVDALKKEGKFDKESQILALTKAKDIALSQMTEDVKEFIQTNYGELDLWLTIQIEATINTLKMKK
ncbi:MAG: hypothetical protein KH380_00175 [Coprobacillus sp.]|jgi:hypothetical protein|nr:hypothetical protein [Coprobacillus sp.]